MNQVQTMALTFTKQPFIEDEGDRRIDKWEFGAMSDKEIANMAEAQVFKGQYYDSQRIPIEGGLLDPNLGPAHKKSKECATCGARNPDCPGHFGYLELALPVYNVGYLSNVVNILKCICKLCSSILLEEGIRSQFLKKMRSPKMESLRKSELMKTIVKKCNNLIKCPKCGYLNGSVKKTVGMVGISHERLKIEAVKQEFESTTISPIKKDSIANVALNPARVFSLFKRMADEDCELLYLSSRPENLLMRNIAVPPIAIRPSVIVDGSQSNENDITERLKKIIQSNASLQQDLLEANSAVKCLASWDILQLEVAQYINSDVRGAPYGMQPAKPLSGLVQRLKGKGGRFRGNLSGKRVEFTGRTVISPDPNLKITEVGIPIKMAQILTYPERVSHHNIEKLRQCVSNGPDKYPGARTIRHPDGSQWALTVSGVKRKNISDGLKYGQIVERHLEDGDIVLFNRQPSLHRMSLMCHRAKIMPWRTLRFNESVCNPYNADFDGDEMNMHVPQTEEARTEAVMLMGVQNNLCTPKNGEILVASTQDFLTSSFLITRKDTFYDRASFSLICSYMGDGTDPVDLPTPAVVKPIELWTGKQLFSVLVRPNSNVRVYLNFTVKEKSYRKTENGRQVEAMCPNDGFVYFRNSELLAGQLGKGTLGNGNKDGLYSVLLRDYKAHAAAACMNRLAKLSARWIGNHGFSIGISDVQPSVELYDEKEKLIKEGYNECDGKIKLYNEGKLPLAPGCDAAQSLESGLTGVLNNIRDQTGKLCMQKLHWRNSPLIMSQCGSKGSPINISQMVACVGQQSVGGRRAPNGFIDRSLPHFPRKAKTPAVKTAETGYMSRRLSKILEDLSVQYDNTVRNASGCIVQFCYGDDGMDPAMMEGDNGAPLDLHRLFLKAKATCPDRETENLSPDEVSEIVRSRLSKQDMTPDGGCSARFKSSLEEFLDKYVKELRKTHQSFLLDSSPAGKENSSTKEKIVQSISGVTSKQLEVFLYTCISRYHSKKVEAGTAIGVIGAQSIGEPGTQMTLKTFHFAGVASMNVTLGVPRIKEIINGAKKISTPIVTAVLERDDNPKLARVVAGRIEKTNLQQVAKSIKIVMTSRSASIVITLDMILIQNAHLSVDANVVKESILRTPKIQLKQEHINVLDIRKLEILPPVTDRSKLHFHLYHLKNILPKVVVRGISSVQRVVINAEDVKKGKNDAADDKREEKKYKLFAEGTGLLAVMGTEGVDGCKTTSNDVMEVQRTLGIEAARVCIIGEIKHTMKSHGMNIDDRHMIFLADVMTYRGEVLGITRFGVQKMDKSVLMLASFERTDDILFNACVNGRVDKVEGVSESIIMGIPMKIGTGIIKLKQRVSSSLPQLTDSRPHSDIQLDYGPPLIQT